MSIRDEVLRDARGFMRSRVILAGASLDLFTRLHEEPAGAGDLAAVLGSDPRATKRLLDCLVAYGLLEKQEDLYRTTERGSLLSSAHPESIRPMILHLDRLWGNWSHLEDAVKLGKNPYRRPVHQEGGKALEAFIGAMHVVGRELSMEVAASFDAGPHEVLLDVGGGSGTYTIAFLRRHPHLRGILFDMPEVIRMAGSRLEKEGLLGRVELVAGDFYEDELPPGSDLALLSAIIHQNGPRENLDLFRKIHRALAPGGILLIRDHVMSEDRAEPPDGAQFALNMLVCTEGGDTYTAREIQDALVEAGFTGVSSIRRGERMDCLVEARKPREAD